MVRSMTAFAHVQRSGPRAALGWELRSVNHRYLELNFRLPEAFGDLEGALRESVRQDISRGKLECTLHYQELPGSQRLTLDAQRAQEVIAAARSIARLLEQPAPVNPLEVLAWPGVLVTRAVDTDDLKSDALTTFQQALEQLKAGRAREGEQLAALLESRVQSIVEEVALLRGLLPKMLANQRRRILERCAELELEMDPQRLEQELLLLAQKTDVAEELDRLLTHVAEVRLILKGDAPAGRRLDFLMQELNREANTLGAKAFDQRSTQAAINLKVLIEQMREQIQNIE